MSKFTHVSADATTQVVHVEPPLLVPVPEAARLLGIGATLAWELVNNKQIPSVRLGRRVLIARQAIDQIVNDGIAA